MIINNNISNNFSNKFTNKQSQQHQLEQKLLFLLIFIQIYICIYFNHNYVICDDPKSSPSQSSSLKINSSNYHVSSSNNVIQKSLALCTFHSDCSWHSRCYSGRCICDIGYYHNNLTGNCDKILCKQDSDCYDKQEKTRCILYYNYKYNYTKCDCNSETYIDISSQTCLWMNDDTLVFKIGIPLSIILLCTLVALCIFCIIRYRRRRILLQQNHRTQMFNTRTTMIGSSAPTPSAPPLPSEPPYIRGHYQNSQVLVHYTTPPSPQYNLNYQTPPQQPYISTHYKY